METKASRTLKVVSSSGAGAQQAPDSPREVQQSLFPLRSPRSAIFISLPDVDHVDFLAVLKNSGPAVVVELRKVPRFDIGPLNRRSIFDLFKQQGDVYLDLGMEELEEPDLQDFATSIESKLQDHLTKQRPILFLTSSVQNSPTLSQSISEWLQKSSEPWEIYEVPHHVSRAAMTPEPRL